MRKILSALKHNVLIGIVMLPVFALMAMSVAVPDAVMSAKGNSDPVNAVSNNTGDSLAHYFKAPPRESRPGVIWDWMGGMISREGITKDLEALAKQGIGGVLVLQVIDQPAWPEYWSFSDYPGKVKVLSDEWFGLVNYAIGESDRLGLTFSILISPGWSHAGLPSITPEHGLKRLHAAKIEVKGPVKFDQVIPLGKLPVRKDKPDSSENFYRDVAVLAMPVPGENKVIPEKSVIELTANMSADGRLKWDVPGGSWTITRLGITSDNSINHPAPPEAMGLESDRMDPKAIRLVFDGMIGRILREAKAKGYRSFKAFETDSYEAGFQDFGLDYREQFKKRRGYDCVPWLPAWIDHKNIINNSKHSERFRADMIRTITELYVERFHGELRRLADENDVEWMTEPYFMLPTDWRTTGAQSRLPGAEFWVDKGMPVYGPSIDIAALYGLDVVWAESFTSESYNSAWRNDPQVLKPYGDNAFCRGVNQLYLHGFTHNPFDDRIRPGFTMGYWGTQLSRHLTWWPYSASWHRYLARCSYMLRQGRPVNDVLAYPPVIEHLPGAVVNAGQYRQVVLNDEALLTRLSVSNGRIAVKGGGDFAAITLTPNLALRPEALQKIRDLVKDGATLIGMAPPAVSSSLEGYPECDKRIAELINEIWGNGSGTGKFNEHALGKGRVLATTQLAEALDMVAGGPDVRFNTTSADEQAALNFGHRRDGATDIYFVCSKANKAIAATVDFRVTGKTPGLWDPLTGERQAVQWQEKEGRTVVSLEFAPQQSFFIVFKKTENPDVKTMAVKNTETRLRVIDGPWDVAFDPKWGGPQKVTFSKLDDWAKRPEKGIRFYSGTATYQKTFDMAAINNTAKLYLDIGEVHNMARVSLNGRQLGVVWCAPWRIEIPAGLLKKKGNKLNIDVVNTWVNRMIGDEHEPVDTERVKWDYANRKGSYDINIPGYGLKDLPQWLTKGEKRPSVGRYTFGTWYFYNKDAPLPTSGLLGPVSIVAVAGK